ncbi:MAG: SUMF1/EgtB/PvdO family nonheme iron enzyme [Polyangiaceae bacterium]|nr:SUMF1/EgtB/PvdO family nonheme iron enzyme [Polyangiaceae bacterium]
MATLVDLACSQIVGIEETVAVHPSGNGGAAGLAEGGEAGGGTPSAGTALAGAAGRSEAQAAGSTGGGGSGGGAPSAGAGGRGDTGLAGGSGGGAPSAGAGGRGDTGTAGFPEGGVTFGGAPSAGGAPGGATPTGGGVRSEAGAMALSGGGMAEGGAPSAGAGRRGQAGEAGAGGRGDCVGITPRCGEAGREICESGQWVSAACPLDTPTCLQGQCVVRGPTMVRVDTYFIDSTEVTVAQYAEFLAAKAGDTSGQPEVCAWNDHFERDYEEGGDDWPVTQVDWCDATAYCKWADKHLCRGLDGAALDQDELYDASKSQWIRACGGPSGSIFPNPSPDCNNSGGWGDVAAVATFPGCEGYFEGLFDMVGNVAEWVDSCEGTEGASDICPLLGGSIQEAKGSCPMYAYQYPRDATAGTFGFRCCSG